MANGDGIAIQCPSKLLPLLTTPKRVKIAVGGRGSAKSTTFADSWLRYCDAGERLCAARMYQNSIEESVHSMIEARISDLGLSAPRIRTTKNRVMSAKGGEIFYKGLAKSINSLLSMHGVKRFWVEEAHTCTAEILNKLLPTMRSKGSEIWFSLNRGRSTDDFSRLMLKPYEKELKRNGGIYEDEYVLIVDINYWENPWFPEELEQQRQMDRTRLSPAEYDHIWHGAYADTVEGAIISPDWFDACIDAHVKLGIEPRGAEVVGFDPADSGDNRALAYRHGIVVKDVQYRNDIDVNDATDWALAYAIVKRADCFVWDGDGLGLSLRRQVEGGLLGKKIEARMFRGSQKPDFPEKFYEPIEQELMSAHDRKKHTISDLVVNKRAQYWLYLRDRMLRTYLAVRRKMYVDPEQMISFSSEIEDLDLLRAEICSVPKQDNLSGKFQVMSKADMKKKDISSPDGADAVMMTLTGVDALRTSTVTYSQAATDYYIDPTVGY